MKRMIWVVAVLCWAFVSDPAGPYSPWVYGAEAREPVLQVKKPGHSLPVKGIYGVPSIKQGDPFADSREMEKDGVNAVFVPGEKETVEWYKVRGYQVYVAVNAFGGKGAWKKYPDARPVKDDGGLLGEEADFKGHGGVCPTHEGWRKERLEYVARLVETLGGDGGIDGIWLDFIRYPGFWETDAPEIPDTCYCSRCLKQFAVDSGIWLPKEVPTKAVAEWIKGNAPLEWMKWKQEQIASFVWAVKKILVENPGKRKIKLGLFVVPWTKGERKNAVSYLLAQDPFELGNLVDVISPMVYHRMSGKSAQWVAYMVDYYRETAKCEVWPIVQAEGCGPKEFGEAVRWAWRGGADGVLVYSHRGWRLAHGAEGRAQGLEEHKIAGEGFVSVGAEDEWGEEWVMPLGGCVAGEEYVFTGKFWRNRWENGVYPEVSLWGKRFRVNTHLKVREWQPVRVNAVCPEVVKDANFRLINRNRGTVFKLKEASVKRKYRFSGEPGGVVENDFFDGAFFPIGVYGADLGNLAAIKRLAVNTVILGGRGDKLKEKVLKSQRLGLRYVVSVPHDPNRLPVFLDRLAQYARPQDMAFYVNDEPGIWSFPINRANDINRLIKEWFPGCATCMAVVRPQVCGDYAQAADFFMMDQYPVPYMPMSWLSDSMAKGAEGMAHGGEGRIAAVIQAFGGERWTDFGWPRLPTEREMNCLAFLSVANGARGIFFYTYGVMGQTEKGRQALGRVVGRLNQVYPWLLVDNYKEKVTVEMLSENRLDPKGRPAVQSCVKRKNGEWLLLVVNTIGTGVEAQVEALSAGRVREVFVREDYVVRNGKIRFKLEAYGVKVFLGKKDSP